jgi:ribonucleoside-diphosphate reductase alpha chain
MKLARHFTEDGIDPFSYVEWKEVSTTIKNENTNEIIFKIENIEIPAHWSQISQDIILSKYLRLTNVPSKSIKVSESTPSGKQISDWLQRSTPVDGCQFGPETSTKQIFHRLAGFWAYWGWWYGYFDEEADAKIFYDESVYMLINQIAAPNTPQWFNSGVYWAYGHAGKKKGFWKADPKTCVANETSNTYENPGIHACFLQSVGDSLFEEDGIFNRIVSEARAFVSGGGSGSNFSAIRSKFEKLSSGNPATGLMSFLKIFDRSAGVVKSGSSQRKAAKMVVVDIDHPEAPEFILWKGIEEKKTQALAIGGFDAGWEGEAYQTVSGQNSNNSIRLSKKFLDAVVGDVMWDMTARTTGQVIRRMKARELWQYIKKAAWESGDPGVQYDDIINDWNTCKSDGRIKTSNPCLEYTFLDDTACNLATLNLQTLFHDNGDLKIKDFIAACRHWLMVLDISINAAQLPTKQLAEGTVKYRTTGLGHSGIGAVLMRAGIKYDCDKACHLSAAVTSLMTAECYSVSADMARTLGTFPRYEANKDCMQQVLRNHCAASVRKSLKSFSFRNLTVTPWSIDHSFINDELTNTIEAAWDNAITQGDKFGYRNAFVTVIQPSGTIGLVLGCDTTAIEPDFGIVKFKRLSGGGSMKIVNESVETSLRNLGYSDSQVDDIMIYVLGNNTFDGAPYINRQSLLDVGVTVDDLDEIEANLSGVSQLRYALMPYKLSDDTLQAIDIDKKSTNIFTALKFTQEQYIEANKWICGYGTLEGAPHIRSEHLSIFDCANRSGYGKRFINPEAHVRMCSAVSPFISGAISKTVNEPNEATEDDIGNLYLMAFDGRGSTRYCPGGIKGFAVYRDGSKQSQPLNNPTDMSWWSDSCKDARVYLRGDRRRPPRKRELVAHEVTIYTTQGHHKIIIKFGEYEDGSLAEIWIEVGKSNPDFTLAMRWMSRSMSNAIQYGQPIKEIADSFLNEEGGPAGRTDHPYITYCSSVPDLVVKLAMLEYEGDTTYCKKIPAEHEVRRGMIKNGKNGHNGNGHKSQNESVLGQRTFIAATKGRGCSKCGSELIQEFPCKLCLSCGTSLGGCSP